MMRWRSAIEVSRFVSSRAGPLFYLAPNGFFFCSFTSFLPGFSFSPLFFSLPDRNGSVYDGAAGRWRRSTAAIAPPSSSPVSSWILLGFQPSFTRYSHECAPWPPRRCAAYLMMRRPARFAFDGVSFLFLFFLNRFHAIRTEFFFFFTEFQPETWLDRSTRRFSYRSIGHAVCAFDFSVGNLRRHSLVGSSTNHSASRKFFHRSRFIAAFLLDFSSSSGVIFSCSVLRTSRLLVEFLVLRNL